MADTVYGSHSTLLRLGVFHFFYFFYFFYYFFYFF